MNKKLLTVLQTKCKDFGLTDNAIEDLCKTGSEGLADDASDEDIEKKADSLVPFARMMQGEVTRKAQKKSPKETKETKTTTEKEEKGGESEEPDWFKTYRAEQEKKLAAITAENEKLKSERSKSERDALIAKTAEELGIPSFLMKRISIADDADVKKELTEYKQELVNNKLVSAEEADITSSSAEAAKDDAQAWAKSLPDN